MLANDFNERVIAEFRANDGVVGGPYEGVPLVLLHHVGRRSGRRYLAPVVYRREGLDRIFVFASAAGAPDNPAWYANLVAAGRGHIEAGSPSGGIDQHDVSVTDLHGGERDRVYRAQVADMPVFAEYQQRARGARTIPVLALDRTS